MNVITLTDEQLERVRTVFAEAGAVGMLGLHSSPLDESVVAELDHGTAVPDAKGMWLSFGETDGDLEASMFSRPAIGVYAGVVNGASVQVVGASTTGLAVIDWDEDAIPRDRWDAYDQPRRRIAWDDITAVHFF